MTAEFMTVILVVIGVGVVCLFGMMASVMNNQRDLAQMLMAMSSSPKERTDAHKVASELKAAQAESKARMEEAIRQQDRALELAARQVFLLEQVLEEFRFQRPQTKASSNHQHNIT